MRLAAKSNVEISTFGVGIRLSHSTQPVFENVEAGKEELKDPRTGRASSTDDRGHRITKYGYETSRMDGDDECSDGSRSGIEKK